MILWTIGLGLKFGTLDCSLALRYLEGLFRTKKLFVMGLGQQNKDQVCACVCVVVKFQVPQQDSLCSSPRRTATSHSVGPRLHLRRSQTVGSPSHPPSHSSYGDCLQVKREYYQNCSVLGCVRQWSQSAAHSCEQFLQVQQIGFVTLEPLRCA